MDRGAARNRPTGSRAVVQTAGWIRHPRSPATPHRNPGIGLFTWFLRMVVVWCTMHAFHLALPAVAAASVLVAINLGITAIAAPGNLGVFEMSAMAALALWQVPGELASF